MHCHRNYVIKILDMLERKTKRVLKPGKPSPKRGPGELNALSP
jgi:hypothetical protein